MIAGTFETEERRVLQHHLASADLFVDIGANVGYFTCLACSMGKHVIAVEPLPTNLRYLYANLQANGWSDRVEVYPVGLADKPGLASLYGGGTGASLVPGWAGVSMSFRRTIPLSTLDIFLGNRFDDKRMVIKIDVEGAEYAALLGASHVLGIVPRPVWLVEITLSKHRRDDRNPHFLDTFDLFWSLGYKAASVGRPRWAICRSDIRRCLDTGVEPDWMTENYLFTDGSD
jgi:FkbM family methyltransferase